VGTSPTAGQRALDVALTGKLGNRTVIGLAAELGVTLSCLHEAKAVLDDAPGPLLLAIDGSNPLNERMRLHYPGSGSDLAKWPDLGKQAASWRAYKRASSFARQL
jgi:hypothetical protein